MNAQFKWEWAKSIWWIILGGVPISFLFYYSTRWSYEYFGQYWAIRQLGFGMATNVFGILTHFFCYQQAIMFRYMYCVVGQID